jgi:thiol-disulfide isomerase/thioredoxin
MEMSLKCDALRLEILQKMCAGWGKTLYICFLNRSEKSFNFYEKWKLASTMRKDVCWAHVNCDKHPKIKESYNIDVCPSFCVKYPNGSVQCTNVAHLQMHTTKLSPETSGSGLSADLTGMSHCDDDDRSGADDDRGGHAIRNKHIQSVDMLHQRKRSGPVNVLFTNGRQDVSKWNEAVLRSSTPDSWYVFDSSRVAGTPIEDDPPVVIQFKNGRKYRYPHRLEDGAHALLTWCSDDGRRATKTALGNAEVATKSDIHKLLDTRNKHPVKNVNVLYYADWCGHCRTLKDTWNSIVCDDMDNRDVVYCTIEEGEQRELSDTEDIRGFPTIKKYTAGGDEDFEGPRDKKMIKLFSTQIANP